MAVTAVGVIALVVALSMISLSLYQDNQLLQLGAGELPTTGSPLAQGSGGIANPDNRQTLPPDITVSEAAPEAAVRSDPVASVKPDVQDAPPPPAPPDLEARDRYKELLRAFEGNLEPEINSQSFAVWRPEQQKDIQFLKQASLAAFGAGEFGPAVTQLTKATETAERVLAEKRDAYARALNAARSARDAYSYEEAQVQVDKALELEPEAQEARALADEISKLPKIINALEKAKIARAENNLHAEYKALNEVLALDPSRSLHKERALFLASEIKQMEFAGHIKKGFSDIEKGNLEAAEASLKRAQNLYPKRPETAQLAAVVKDLKISKQTEALLAKAKTAATSDNWEASLTFFEQAGSLQPDNQQAVRGISAAQQVVSLKTRLSGFISAPHRLAAANVAKAAKNVLKEAGTVRDASPSLSARYDELNELLIAYAKPKPVTVLSDAQTHILVKGVGVVGSVSEKTIELKPGTYTFEGKRRGFKSKLVRITISPQSTDLIVKLICDEPI